MGEIIKFKKLSEPVHESAHESFADMRELTYKKLLPRGIPQHVADKFLDEFKPILNSMIPPSIILAEIKEGDPNFQAYDQVAKNAQEQINDYVLGVIGSTFNREMVHFLKEYRKQLKE